MGFATIVFRIAGSIGLLSLPGMYLLDASPLYYAALAGLAAWQPAFFVIANDPVRFRPLMIPALLEKAIWVVTFAILYAQGAVSASEAIFFIPASVIFAALFLTARAKTPA